jgi:transmembrane sensor
MKEMNKNHADELIAAYLAGDISAREEQKLMAWVDSSSDNQKFFDQAINIWQAADDYVYPDFSANKTAAFERLNQRLDRAGGQAKVHQLAARHRGQRWLRIAAAALVLLAVGWWWQSPKGDEMVTLLALTQPGEQKTVILPDGTAVWLNEESELRYEEQDEERFVRFRGEGYFQVATDSLRPFRVYTGQAVTTVLGTAFNLRAYPDEPAVEVSVTEGRVALEVTVQQQETASPKRVELVAGKVGIYERAAAQVKEEVSSVTNKLAWKEQVLNFEGVPLRQAIRDLERYFDVSIIVAESAMLDCSLQVSEYQKPQLDEMLGILQFSLEFEVDRQGDSIILRGGHCQ